MSGELLRPPLPVMCAKCNKPVDEVRIQDIDFGHARKYQARCHGEVDECTVSMEFFATVERLSDMVVVAFQDNKLPEPQKLLEEKTNEEKET